MILFNFSGEFKEENCHCPEKDISKWFIDMHCNQTYSQINNDMAKFANVTIDMDILRNIIVNKFNSRYSQSLCNYIILDNKVGYY